MSKRYSLETRSEVLDKIRNGSKVSSVANEYGINEGTVRNWLLREKGGSRGSETLELSRLRRENQQLYRLLDQLTSKSELEIKASIAKAAESGTKSQLARELGVSRSSFYHKRKMPEKDEALRREIEVVLEANPDYGSPRVAMALGINKKRAERVMRKFGLKPALSNKMPKEAEGKCRERSKYENVLARLSPIAPDVVWASDFTLITFRGEFICLYTVLDVFTGEILSFNISNTHDAQFVKLAIERAINRTNTLPQWFHSDQGSEYSSDTVSSWLETQGVQISMNPKGFPWCNGLQESFFGRLKVEFGDFERFKTCTELFQALNSHLSYFTNFKSIRLSRRGC